MRKELEKTIEQIRNNAKCQKILVIGVDKEVLKKIDGMNLEDVSTFLTNPDYLSEDNKLYILPNYQEEPRLYLKHEPLEPVF